MNKTVGLSFDDVLLEPKYSEISSRDEIDLSVDLGKNIKLTNAFASANMKNITGEEMVEAVNSCGGLPILHRFWKNSEEQIWALERLHGYTVGCSIGINEEDKITFNKLVETGCKIICIDVAHGDHINSVKMTEFAANIIASQYSSKILLISGNVSTSSGALRLYDAGADVIKVGQGTGSFCSTRIHTGNGVPQLTALESIYEVSQGSFARSPSGYDATRKFKIIADGGFKNSGDCVKALCFSDVVMLGRLLAGTDEAPGKMTEIDGKRYKEYNRSSTYKAKYVEGVKFLVPAIGPVGVVIKSLLEGIRSGCSYQGVRNLTELKVDPKFVTITNSGLRESYPHHIQER